MTEKDILSKVIGVETEIQEKLMSEKERSREWLEKVRAEAEDAIAKEKERLQESFESTKAGFAAGAANKAAEILAEANRVKERISGIGDDVLSRVLEKQIAAILPCGGQADSERSGACGP